MKLTPPFDLIRKSITIFSNKKNLLYLIKIYLPLLPFSIIALIQNYLPASIRDSQATWFVVTVSIIQIAYFFVFIFVSVSGIAAVRKVVEGEPLLVKSTFRSGWKKYWVFLLLNLILSLAYLLGFALLIVPGILFVVWFTFSRFLILEPSTGVKASLVKSKEMTKGLFWKILGRIVVFGIFSMVVQMLLAFLPFGLGSAVGSLVGGLFLLPFYLLYKEVKG